MLDEWAAEFGVSPAALYVLKVRLGVVAAHWEPAPAAPRSEAAVQNDIRLAAPAAGVRLWRNNVGALLDKRGVPVRYGLANDSATINKVCKSGDLIGIEPVVVTAAHVGRTIGRFVSIECKVPGFVYNPADPHLVAQMNWANLVNAAGGRAVFATGAGCLA